MIVSFKIFFFSNIACHINEHALIDQNMLIISCRGFILEIIFEVWLKHFQVSVQKHQIIKSQILSAKFWVIHITNLSHGDVSVNIMLSYHYVIIVYIILDTIFIYYYTYTTILYIFILFHIQNIQSRISQMSLTIQFWNERNISKSVWLLPFSINISMDVCNIEDCELGLLRRENR